MKTYFKTLWQDPAAARKALVNQPEPRGVADLAKLPYLLEDKGVAWDINGNGNQVTTATITSYNDNASMLDQVVLTRDTNSAYAWVDRYNVLKAYTNANLSSTPVFGFYDIPYDGDDTAEEYSDIDAGYNTEDIINSVMVTWLRYDSTTGSTEEITYGPYQDADSIATYGPREKTFTIQGTVENSASIQVWADAIVAAHKDPVRRANSISYPVRDDRSLMHAATTDLYDYVGVSFSDIISDYYRVTSISHQIVATGDGGRWHTTYGFSLEGAVASPTVTPSPGDKGSTGNTTITGDVVFKGGITADNFVKVGSATVNVAAINTNATTTVTFTNAFPASGPVPTIMLTVYGATANFTAKVSPSGISRSGFTINLVRSAGTGNTVVGWVAVAQ